MTTNVYNAGLDLLRILVSAASDFEWMLFEDSYTFSADHALVTADLAPATHELVAVGYARDTTVASPTRTVDNTNDRITYDCADLTFGTVAAGTAAEYAILIYSPSGDATAIPVLCATLDQFASDALPNLAISVRGLAQLTQAT